jgi:hypothetical protein
MRDGLVIGAGSNDGTIRAGMAAACARLPLSRKQTSYTQDDRGRPLLTFALPDTAALDDVSNILARLLAGIQSRIAVR